MIVMKFGGTSIEDAPSIERVIEIVRARLEAQPIVVVSAMGKTTRKLLDAASASASGNRPAALETVIEIRDAHTSEVRRLMGDDRASETLNRFELYFDELNTLLEGLAILGEVPPRGLDKILSYGELLSSAIVAGAMVERGILSRLFDSREIIKTDDRYGEASPIVEITALNIRGAMASAIERGEVPVLQGFIGSTREGATTTLGFEGSDYTATIIGAALDASDIQIWKDVSGLMTADPSVYADARTVKACSFAEAGELTYFGAKVLHPKAIHPAARKNIAVHIYNSKRPDATGTVITGTAPECKNLIKSIAYKKPVTVVSSTGEQSRFLSPNDFLRALLDVLRRRRIRPMLTAVSGLRVVLAVDSNMLSDGGERDFIEEVSKFSYSDMETGKAMVSLVGAELRKDPALIGHVFAAIDRTSLDIIMHGSSPLTINLVVSERDVESMIARLHEVFFDQLDSRVFE